MAHFASDAIYGVIPLFVILYQFYKSLMEVYIYINAFLLPFFKYSKRPGGRRRRNLINTSLALEVRLDSFEQRCPWGRENSWLFRGGGAIITDGEISGLFFFKGSRFPLKYHPHTQEKKRGKPDDAVQSVEFFSRLVD